MWHRATVDRTAIPQPLPLRRADTRLDGACAWAAWFLPLVLGIWSTSGWPTWRDDLAVVRDLGFVPVGSEGILSTILSQLAVLVPVGGRLLRASLVGVLALAACSRLLFGLFRDLLDSEIPFAPNPVLALLASQLWAADPELQYDVSRAGSPALALVIVLIGMRMTSGASRKLPLFPVMGVLIAMATAENHAAGLTLLLVFVSSWLSATRAPTRRRLLGFAGAFSVALAVCGLLPGLRPLSPNRWIDLGFNSPEAFAGLSDGMPAPRMGQLWQDLFTFWIERLGVIAVLLAVAGAGWALRRSGLRRALIPWGVLMGLGGAGALASNLGATRLLPWLTWMSSVGLVAFVPVALQAIVHGLWTCRLPFARSASVLSITFAVTLVLQRFDERSPADRTPALGAELLTEEAYGKLPTGSVALVQSRALVFRLLAARVLQGHRADVVLVPVSLLSRASLTQELLRSEPELSALLRQLAVHGFADEYALCRLADARPLFLELDPHWDARLLQHLRPDAMWLGFSPHALGAPDRRSGVERSRAALRRILTPFEAEGSMDEATRRVLAELTGQQALTLAALGDREDATKLLRILRRIGKNQPLVAQLAARLRDRERGPVAINDLID